MKDWNNTATSKEVKTEVKNERVEKSKWTGGFPSLNLISLSPLSTPLGE